MDVRLVRHINDSVALRRGRRNQCDNGRGCFSMLQPSISNDTVSSVNLLERYGQSSILKQGVEDR